MKAAAAKRPSEATTISAHGFSRGKKEQFGEALEGRHNG